MTADAGAEGSAPIPVERPSQAELRGRGLDDHKAGRLDRAFAAYRAVLAADPDDAGVWTNLGALLRARGEHRLAVSCQRRAAALKPDDEGVLNNLGNALADADFTDEALAVRRDLARRRPGDRQAQAMLVASLRAAGRMEQAVAAADAALAGTPGDPELRMQRAMALLALGDYARGFADFAARWDTGEVTRPPAPEPEWRGGPLTGKRLLVLPEQGLGDTILMARFLPGLAAFDPAEVVLAVRAPLLRLFRDLPGVHRLVPADGPRPSADLHLHMMDLPGRLGARPDALPHSPPLHVPDDSSARARRLLGPFAGRFKVGVVWSGSVTYRGNHKRSVTPRSFAPLSDLPGVQLFSLYKGPLLDRFRASADTALIVEASGTDRDLADAAGMIRGLDLVIGVDTGVMHLAGALGRPVWNLLAHAPYWLYGTAGEGTPWHPTMRLFRQRAPGDWDEVMGRVTEALRAAAAAGEAR